MQISDEGKIGIALALLGLGGGGALFVLPHPYADYVGWSLIGGSAFGLILLALHHFKLTRRGWRQMWPQYLMVISGIGFFAGLIGFLQLNVTPPVQTQKEASGPKNPSLFSLFMSEHIPATGMVWNCFTDYELYDSAVKVRVFYNIQDDFGSNTKFMSFYVPGIFVKDKEDPPAQSLMIAEDIASKYKQFIDDVQAKRWAEFHTPGITDFDSTKSALFSGRIYFYHGDSLSIEQQSDLRKVFRSNGADVRFIGFDFTFLVESQVHLGKAKMPPQYKFENNVPVRLPD